MYCCTPFFKGMILAAGRGKRMGYLTEDLPKPLLPVRGQPLIRFPLRLFQHWGINYIVVNTWYKKSIMIDYLTKIDLPLRVKISIEDSLLGTGGGVKKAQIYLQNTPFFLINSDIITDFPLKTLIVDPLPIATMVLVPYRQGDTPVWIKDGKITAIGKKGTGKPYTFAGIHLLRGDIFKYIPDGNSSIINTLYRSLLEKGEFIRGVIWDGLWLDLGTKEKYEEIKAEIETGVLQLPSYLLDGGSISYS